MSSVSVLGKKWILKEFNNEDVNFYKNQFFVDDIIAKLLSIRKIPREDVMNYLEPTIKNSIPNPSVLVDMEKATVRTLECIINKEPIGVFGDYDVDGATATAILGRYFNSINQKCEIYIPDRQTEGYGPSEIGFSKLIKKNIKLIFTVDCGTLSFDPIKFAKKKNVDVIVLDHHQSEVKLPNAHSVVNPNRLDDQSNLDYLCAAGVCFMFLVALNKKLRQEGWFNKNSIKEPNLIDYLDLVSLGTVCDVVPLVGLNRAIVKQGLKIIKNKTNLGLKTLFEICKIDISPNTYHLGYVLGPRINAGGRVGKCSHGANLLLNNSAKETFKIAVELNNFNKERQLLESELLSKILNINYNNSSDPVLILHGENWHEGVIGIIASRIKDKFNKPTIIISTKDNIGKGSARSIYGFDIGSTILSAVYEKILIKGGGHKMAGGFTIDMSKISRFKEFVFKRFKSVNINLSLQRDYYFDSEIAPSALNTNFFNKVYTLSPFGSGNSEPRFIINDLKLIKSTVVGEKHIKSIFVGSDDSQVKSIAFNVVDNDIGQYLLKREKNLYNIAGKMTLNEWRGQKNVEFIIDDISVNKVSKKKVPSSIG
tara:strand:+ start:160 stop:1944 length:1785 start_codon:yes stop_codon:yes gene_type:complete